MRKICGSLLLAFALLLGGCGRTGDNTGSGTADKGAQDVKPDAVTVEENAVYFAPEDPTAYIAKTYDELTSALKKAGYKTEIKEEKVADDESEEVEEGDETLTAEEETVSEIPEAESLAPKNISAQNAQAISEAVCKAFVADFFTLKNKDNANEIGGLDYIPSPSTENFRSYAKYYYYDELPLITNEQGRDALPEVSEVKLSNVKKATGVEYLGEKYNGYTMDCEIVYAGSPDADTFKTTCKCTIIQLSDVHYVDPADVTTDRVPGEPQEVFKILTLEDR